MVRTTIATEYYQWLKFSVTYILTMDRDWHNAISHDKTYLPVRNVEVKEFIFEE